MLKVIKTKTMNANSYEAKLTHIEYQKVSRKSLIE